jgi:uncharacterized protein YbbC (DUF1343 family)
MATVATGLDVFLADDASALGNERIGVAFGKVSFSYASALAGRRIGLLTNPTAVDHQFTSSIDLLRASPAVDLCALFGPEHGVRGDAQAGIDVATSINERTGLPAYSLYGNTRRPTPAMLADLDTLVFDMQDFGVRYATYFSTLLYAQAACAEAEVQFVVFDRPNPLGGQIEGALLDPAYASFVGVAAVPVLHGMTLGELALMVASEQGLPKPLVVPMRDYERGMWFDQTGLPWVPLSPNLPTLDTLTVYGGTCLIEGTNCSEGRGTTRPFEIIGAPWLDPFELARALMDRELSGVTFRPTFFTPTFQKHAGTTCGGIQVHVTNRTVFRPVRTGLHILETVRQRSGDHFQWTEGPHGFFVDLLLGSPIPRQALDAGVSAADIIAEWTDDERNFEQRRQPFLLYPS